MRSAATLTSELHRVGTLVCSQNSRDIEAGFDLLAAQAASPSLAAAWLRAARAFFQSTSGGRPAIDDAGPLREVADLIQGGRTAHGAIELVARRLGRHSGHPKSIYARLSRKWKNHPQNRFCR